jgi:hypothetical protein
MRRRYRDVWVYRTVLSFRAPHRFNPVSARIPLPYEGGTQTYQISDFAGRQPEAERLAQKIADALVNGEEPPYPDDGGAPVKRLIARHEGKKQARRERSKAQAEESRIKAQEWFQARQEKQQASRKA